MQTILQLNSSLSGAAGQSSQLASEFASALARASGARVTVRDLATQPVPHLTLERFQAFGTPVAERTLEQQRYVAESDVLIDELRKADTIVLGVPMYNFGVPSTLKAYFDHVARSGVTFRYTAEGPVGLLTGRRSTSLRRAVDSTRALRATCRRRTCGSSSASSACAMSSSSTPRVSRSAQSNAKPRSDAPSSASGSWPPERSSLHPLQSFNP